LKILGCDIAGVVESVGNSVKQFKPGDEVFGDISSCNFGGFAEYVCAEEKALNPKPASMTFEQAAALPQGGVLALQGLIQGGIQQSDVPTGQKVLINGASGGTGSFAVQIAKSFGAEVTGVCRTNKMDFVRSIGADHVVDFTQEDYTKKGERYDLILDLMGFHSIFESRRALTSKGVYVMVGGASGKAVQALFFGPLISRLTENKMGLLLLNPNRGMDSLITLFEAGRYAPIIDRTFPLSETAEAMRFFGEGQKRGKVVISIDADS
ncbi:MAG: NAD(P)-dependent alcohol dehydrogenase, partial [Gammaproteobacteria bacterium]|nr:NAD(P)-dependent alcohol dehydrogenase [Gammaproteobacteria bacterium]